MKKPYTAPFIEVMRIGAEGETCGVPVFFSKNQGPGQAGSKENFYDEEEEWDENADPDREMHPWGE